MNDKLEVISEMQSTLPVCIGDGKWLSALPSVQEQVPEKAKFAIRRLGSDISVDTPTNKIKPTIFQSSVEGNKSTFRRVSPRFTTFRLTE
jgi:hypothetical protein